MFERSTDRTWDLFSNTSVSDVGLSWPVIVPGRWVAVITGLNSPSSSVQMMKLENGKLLEGWSKSVLKFGYINGLLPRPVISWKDGFIMHEKPFTAYYYWLSTNGTWQNASVPSQVFDPNYCSFNEWYSACVTPYSFRMS